jgi:hypothetical protein
VTCVLFGISGPTSTWIRTVLGHRGVSLWSLSSGLHGVGVERRDQVVGQDWRGVEG